MASPRPEEHLAAYAQVQRAADRQILAALRLAHKDVIRDLSNLAKSGRTHESLQRQRLLAVKKSLLEAQADFYDKAGDIIAKRRVEAAARAIKVSERYDEAVFARAGREADLIALSDSLEETEAKAPERMIARLTGSRVPLSERVYRTRAYTQGILENRINSGLARGLSAQEMALEIRDLVNPNTPGGVRFAALRLARTEINNAYHAMAIRAAELKPWVTGLEWHTSDSHPRPDKCDALNKQTFVPAETPAKPHPQCMCYVTEIIGDPNKSDEENDDDFLDDLAGGLFDDFLEEHGADTPAEPEASRELEAVAAPPPPSAAPRRVSLTQGRDLRDQVRADFEAVTTPGQPFMTEDNRWTESEARGIGRPVDGVIRELIDEQGYGLPDVVEASELDDRIAEGWIEAWRGAMDHRASGTTGAEQMRRMREDPDFEPGTGIYGNGWYFSTERQVAQQFSGENHSGHRVFGGAVVRIAVRPQARIMPYEDLKREHEEWLASYNSQDKRYAQMVIGFTDLGRFAAMRGYDGMWIQNEQDGALVNGVTSAAPQIVLFNREVMVIEREDYE